MNKILFLDVDGVLHPFHGVHMPYYRVELFHRDCMSRLARIIQETDAEIVLSTSWRNFISMRNNLAANLSEYGLSFVSWIELDSPGTKTASEGKYSKILSYVQFHHPREWVVIDDEDLIKMSGADPESIMAQLFRSRFVQTNPETGLTDSDVESLISILNDDNEYLSYHMHTITVQNTNVYSSI